MRPRQDIITGQKYKKIQNKVKILLRKQNVVATMENSIVFLNKFDKPLPSSKSSVTEPTICHKINSC